MQYSNPYTAGPPIDDDTKFWGREGVTDRIFELIEHPEQNTLAIYGPRHIGKSSLLLQLECDLSDEDYNQVYIDLKEKSSLLYHDLLYDFATALASAAAVPSPAKRHFLEDDNYFADTFLRVLDKAVGENNLVVLVDELEPHAYARREQTEKGFLPFVVKQVKKCKNINLICSLGRYPEDAFTQAIFDQVERLSLLNDKALEKLIRQSEQNQSLRWEQDAINRIWQLTNGHPYLTQVLCRVIWDNAHKYKPNVTPWAYMRDIDAAIEATKEQASNLYTWMWGNLLAAERTVVASMVDLENGQLREGEIERVLSENEIELEPHDLEFILKRLERGSLIGREDQETHYNRAFPLFWQWVLEHQPLEIVKKEIKGHYALAESLYQVGKSYYEQGKIAEAENELMRATTTDPNHSTARILLSRIFIESNKAANAVFTLKEGSWQNSDELRQQLVSALLARADTEDESAQVSTYEEVLSIESGQAVALERLRLIWLRKGEDALEHNRLREAMTAFEKAQAKGRIEQVRHLLKEYEIKHFFEMAEACEQKEDWAGAVGNYTKLLEYYPDLEDVPNLLRHAKARWKLEQRYQEAVAALDSGDTENAQKIIAEVILRQPNYKDAPKILLKATAGVDVDQLTAKNDRPKIIEQVPPPPLVDQKLKEDLALAQEQIDALQRAAREAGEREEVGVRNLQTARLQIQTLEARFERAQEFAAVKSNIAEPRIARPASQTPPTPPTPKASAKPPAKGGKSLFRRKQRGAPEPDPAVSKQKEQEAWQALSLIDETSPAAESPKAENGEQGAKRLDVQASKSLTAGQKSAPKTSSKIKIRPSRVPSVRRKVENVREKGEPETAVKLPFSGPRPRNREELPWRRKQKKQNIRKDGQNAPESAFDHTAAPPSAEQRDFTAVSRFGGLDPGEINDRQKMASWFASTLLWLPLFAGIVWTWIVNPYDWGNGGKFMVTVSSFIAWLVTSQYGRESKDELISLFLYLGSIISFILSMILASEAMRMGAPEVIVENSNLFLLASIIYILLTAVPIIFSGEIMYATAVGVFGGGIGGAALFAAGGGAIEATAVVAILSATMLLIRQTDIGLSSSGGIFGAIPSGFVIYAMTLRLYSDSIRMSLVSSIFSLFISIAVCALVYLLVKLMKRALGR